MKHEEPLRLAHLVEAMDGDRYIWGKERVIQLLMREQRASGTIDPCLMTFSEGHLRHALEAEGFHALSLANASLHSIPTSIARLKSALASERIDVLHSHGYKANIIARALRISGGARGVRLVSTCHGWVGSDAKVRFYNTLDRWSSGLSDVTTVPDAAMLALMPVHADAVHVLNAVPDLDLADAAVLAESRRWAEDSFVAGTLGRVTRDKGIGEFLMAAAGCGDESIVYCVAGAGDLTGQVAAAPKNVYYAGHVTAPEAYLASLDVYVQASHFEGLSLSLLEAMRAGKAIVATAVGATCDALRDRESALIVPAKDADALREAIVTLKRDPGLRMRLGRNARLRYEREFVIRRQHDRFVTLYRQGATS